MTTIIQNLRSASLKQEIQQIRQTAQKAAISKAAARRSLISPGIYSPSGQLKPQFR